MAGGVTQHRTSERQSTSRLLQLFSSSRDILYGDGLPPVSEVQSETCRAIANESDETANKLSSSSLTPLALDSTSSEKDPE